VVRTFPWTDFQRMPASGRLGRSSSRFGPRRSFLILRGAVSRECTMKQKAAFFGEVPYRGRDGGGVSMRDWFRCWINERKTDGTQNDSLYSGRFIALQLFKNLERQKVRNLSAMRRMFIARSFGDSVSCPSHSMTTFIQGGERLTSPAEAPELSSNDRSDNGVYFLVMPKRGSLGTIWAQSILPFCKLLKLNKFRAGAGRGVEP
jgi:hypothetical protein